MKNVPIVKMLNWKAESLTHTSVGQQPIRTNVIKKQAFFNEFVGFLRPERATRISEGRNPSMKCVRFKPCKGVRLMRVAPSGLKIVIGHFVGLCPTLLRVALSGRKMPEKSTAFARSIVTLVRMGQRPTDGQCDAVKAESLAHSCSVQDVQGFQPCDKFKPFRRALPYASMCKAFGLGVALFG